jgi:anti-sigma regulatory factor (Ser/Thr protein kinase)
MVTAGTTAAATAEILLPGTPRAAAQARRFVADTLIAWGFPAAVEDARLIVSELATNVVVHTGSPRLRLSCAHLDTVVRIAVHDCSRELPVRVAAVSTDDERGRGMRLVDELTRQKWGVHLETSGGKTVWADIRTCR